MNDKQVILDNTPVEIHRMPAWELLVKRDDLCSLPPGPSLAKVRGLYAHLSKRPEQYIGALDGYHSRNGWAMAWVCKMLGKSAVTFYPQRKADPPELRVNQQAAYSLGSAVIALQAGRQTVLQHLAARELRKVWPDNSYMLPNALKVPEAVEANAEEARRTFADLPSAGTVVLPVGSGTMAAGITRGIPATWEVIYVLGYSRNLDTCRKYIEERSGRSFNEFKNVQMVDTGYKYSDAETRIQQPFSCNPYYELKALAWLVSNPIVVERLTRPILFWNFGA